MATVCLMEKLGKTKQISYRSTPEIEVNGIPRPDRVRAIVDQQRG